MRENDSLIKTRILESDLYEVRRDGTVWTKISRNGLSMMEGGQLRRCDSLDRGNYRVVNIYAFSSILKKKHKKKLAVHRIVYQKFLGDLDPTKSINHKNGNKQDNRPENLELITFGENNTHAFKVLGQCPIKNAVLNFEIADEIRVLKAKGWSLNQLSKKYGKSKGHLSAIVNNKIWVKHRDSFEKSK